MYRDMLRRSIPPNEITFSCLLQGCLNRPNWQREIAPIISEIESSGIEITPALAWVMVQALVSINRFDKAILLVRMAEGDDIKLQYEWMAQQVNTIKEARLIRDELLIRDKKGTLTNTGLVWFNLHVFNKIISSLLQKHRKNEVLQLAMEGMPQVYTKKYNHQSDNRGSSRRSCERDRNTNKTVFFDNLQASKTGGRTDMAGEEDISGPTTDLAEFSRTYTQLQIACDRNVRQESKMWMCLPITCNVWTQHILNGFSRYLWLSCKSDEKTRKTAIAVYTYVLRRGIDLRSDHFDAIIQMYSKVGTYAAAIDVIKEMKLRGIPRRVVNYNNAILAALNHHDQKYLRETVHHFRAMMAEDELDPDIFTYNSMILCCEKAGELRLVIKLFKEFKMSGTMSGIVPSCFTVNTFMRVFYDNKRYELVEECYLSKNIVYNNSSSSCSEAKASQRKGDLPPTSPSDKPKRYIFTIMQQAYLAQMEWSKCLQCFEDMKTLQIHPHAPLCIRVFLSYLEAISQYVKLRSGSNSTATVTVRNLGKSNASSSSKAGSLLGQRVEPPPPELDTLLLYFAKMVTFDSVLGLRSRLEVLFNNLEAIELGRGIRLLDQCLRKNLFKFSYLVWVIPSCVPGLDLKASDSEWGLDLSPINDSCEALAEGALEWWAYWLKSNVLKWRKPARITVRCASSKMAEHLSKILTNIGAPVLELKSPGTVIELSTTNMREWITALKRIKKTDMERSAAKGSDTGNYGNGVTLDEEDIVSVADEDTHPELEGFTVKSGNSGSAYQRIVAELETDTPAVAPEVLFEKDGDIRAQGHASSAAHNTPPLRLKSVVIARILDESEGA